MVLAFVLFSELTKAWLLYLGLIFMFMVMYAPGGIASLIMLNLRVASYGRLKELLPHYLSMAATGLVALLGVSALTEMVYHRQLDGAAGSTLNFLGLTLDDANTVHWLAAAAVALVGIAAFEWARRRFARRWHAVQEYIEVEMKKREAAA